MRQTGKDAVLHDYMYKHNQRPYWITNTNSPILPFLIRLAPYLEQFVWHRESFLTKSRY